MKTIKNIVVLASGRSRRLWPLADKTTFSMCGRLLVWHKLKELIPYIGEKLYITANKEQRQEVQQISRELDSRIQVIPEEGQGQASALMACGNLTGQTLVVNVNDFFDSSIIEPLLDLTSGADITMGVKNVADYFPGGYIQHEGDKVKAIVEKPGKGKEPSDLVRLSIDYFADIAEFLAFLQKAKSNSDDLYEVALSDCLKAGKKVAMHVYRGGWIPFKYPWHALSVTQYFLSRQIYSIAPGIRIPDTSIIDGTVVIEEGVKIGNFVRVVGPAYIGKETVVGDYSLIRQSHIGSGSLIGSGCEVARSYMGQEVQLHRNYVGDSILANKVLMGAGAVTANFRFDAKLVGSKVRDSKIETGLLKLGAIIGEQAKIGVNATLLPGVKIGVGSRVWPGETVASDIEDFTIVQKGEAKAIKQ